VFDCCTSPVARRTSHVAPHTSHLTPHTSHLLPACRGALTRTEPPQLRLASSMRCCVICTFKQSVSRFASFKYFNTPHSPPSPPFSPYALTAVLIITSDGSILVIPPPTPPLLPSSSLAHTRQVPHHHVDQRCTSVGRRAAGVTQAFLLAA
jgi:hypothetical protein